MTFSRRGFVLGAVGAGLARGAAGGGSRDYPILPAGVKDVRITDAFWLPRIEKARTVSLPMLLGRAEERGGRTDGRLIEAASYFLMTRPDAPLQREIEDLGGKSLENLRRLKGVWPNRGDGPFFAVGHFVEGAVAHYQATGSHKLLDGAIEISDDLDSVFGPRKRYDIANHEEIELALVKLYRATGEERYLRLAQFLVATRGTTNGGREMFGPYAQDHAPVKSQKRAIGHCVRATYLYCAVADLAALGPDPGYRDAAIRIWEDAIGKRTFLTGGIGSYRDEENFGDDYDLPNLACWNEICAAAGNALWNHRMFLMTGEARYADMMERVLYNSLLAGVSLNGDRFLYQAPLKALSGFERQPWFGPNCCPPNITRLLAELGSLAYAANDESVWINLFLAGQARSKLKQTPVAVTQETAYPWDGKVRIKVDPESPAAFAVRLRIPGWIRGEPMPGGPYRYLDAEGRVVLAVNGRTAPYKTEKGYAVIEREWRRGDAIELTLPMSGRRVQADARVADDRGMVALERGPLVYCTEGLDNQGAVFAALLSDGSRLEYSYRPGLLGGIGAITAEALALARGQDGTSVARRSQVLTAIPYFAFGNRGPTDMTVWLAREESGAVISPAPTVASLSRITSSCGSGSVADDYPGHEPPSVAQRFYPNSQDGSGDIRSICDQVDPPDSEDGSGAFLRLRPQSGDGAWVQYDFAKPAEVSSVKVYWKDDKQCVAPPKSWRLLYRDGGEWQPVRASTPYGVETDRYNEVRFAPVTASALRLDIQLQPKVYKKGALGPPDGNYLEADLTWYEGGVIEWRVT